MSELTGCAVRCHYDEYCDRCDLLVGLPGLHVTGVERDDGGRLRVTAESARQLVGCPTCGVVASSHGRRTVRLVDAPSFGRPIEVLWRKRTWECPEPSCPVGVFTEQDEQVAKPRAMLTVRACWWAVHQIRREHGSVSGVARQLGTAWKTVWGSIKPILQAAATDESRFVGVTTLGVDEHIWHHVSPVKRGPKELTGMVDLTRDKHGLTRARLLDLVPGRSGTVYNDWLKARGEPFRKRVKIATLDPFRGYKNAIDDQLADATAVLDAFHVVKLATQAVDEVRRRVQQDTLGHRGRETTRCTRSGPSCAAARRTSPNVNNTASPRRSPPMSVMKRCTSPGSALNASATSITPPPQPTAGHSPRRS
nr:transposase [Acidipropionibacterium jensenii]